MSRTGKPGHVREQVLSKPDLLREFTPKFDESVQAALSEKVSKSVKRVYGFGCGDSNNAATAAEMAFQRWAGIDMRGMTSLEFARYTTPWLKSDNPEQSLVFGISVSGEVARTVEGVRLAAEAGSPTLGITCNPDSTLSGIADSIVDVTTPFMDIPRVRTYLATQIAVYLMALRLGEANGSLSAAEAQRIRDLFKKAADVGEATHAAISTQVKDLAYELKDAGNFVFAGGGPNLGTAMFSAAKILEAEGSFAQPQDLEEWVHLQRFQKRTGMPTVLIAPPGLSYSRAVEVAKVMKTVQTYLIAVVEEGEKEISSVADVVIPIKGHLPEEVTPLVYSDPMEFFASDLAEANGEPYFRGFEGPWATPDGDPIWFNETLKSLSELNLDT